MYPSQVFILLINLPFHSVHRRHYQLLVFRLVEHDLLGLGFVIWSKGALQHCLCATSSEIRLSMVGALSHESCKLLSRLCVIEGILDAESLNMLLLG